MPISWNTVIFKFRSIFATNERRVMSGIAFHCNALGESCWTVFLLLTRNNGLPKTQQWKPIPNIILRSSVAKIKRNLNDCVLTNGHKIKITQSNIMILVSFSSAGVAWFEDVKRYGTFRLQATENLPFRFLWDTRYIFSQEEETNEIWLIQGTWFLLILFKLVDIQGVQHKWRMVLIRAMVQDFTFGDRLTFY